MVVIRNFILTGLIIAVVTSLNAQSVTTDKAGYVVGEDIVASFSGGLGNSTDWIAIYPQGVVPDGSPPASLWFYTNGTQTSGGNATAGSVTFQNPALAAGNYSLWFLANNGYSAIAGPVNFTIADPPSDPPSWITTTFSRRHVVSGTAYSGKISAYTNFSTFTFSKISGPSWLSISATGELGGTPATNDAGLNTFTVRASDGTNTADATMKIQVFKPGTESLHEIKVMSYNAWHGWGQMNNGHRKGLESIILSGADIIGMQESTDNVSGSGVYQPQKIATDLGWYYRSDISGSLGLISRYPISDQTLAAGIARGIKVRLTSNPLQEVILMNCHLDHTDYGPYAAQLSGATEASVLTEENSSDRDEQIGAIMLAMANILANSDTTPVFLTGDFNAPSHLDWTAATSGSHNGVGNVAWPTSTAVINSGMLDSFRAIHINPVILSGNTWSPVFKGSEPQDRIDFVYFKGASLKPIASQIFTTAVENTTGSWGSSTAPLVNNTWPSDHASVLTTFRLKPVDSDDDGMSDAFENKYFGSLIVQSGEGDADSDGVSNQVEQWLATDPDDNTSKPATPITMPNSPLTSPKISFGLSSSAFDTGVICERSVNLNLWHTVWSYQTDPNLSSPMIDATEMGSGQWSVVITDSGVDTSISNRYFYRIRQGN